MLKKHLVDFSIVIFIFLIDRISKLLIISSPETYEQYGISITSFLNFNLIWNEGIAFGLFSFDEKLYYNLLTIFIILVTTVIIWLTFKSKGFEKFSFIMIIGGSFGNIFDRIFGDADYGIVLLKYTIQGNEYTFMKRSIKRSIFLQVMLFSTNGIYTLFKDRKQELMIFATGHIYRETGTASREVKDKQYSEKIKSEKGILSV